MIRYITLFVIFSSCITYAQTREAAKKLYELYENGNNDEVIKESTRLIQLYPNGENIYYCYYMRGTVYLDQKNYYKGVPDMEKCVSLNPSYENGLDDLYITYREIERYNEEIPLLKKLIEIKDEPHYHFELGLAYLNSNDFNNAITSFTNYLNMDDDVISRNRLALYNRGKAKNSLQKGRGCDDVNSALQKAYIESKYYPASLYYLEFKSLDYAIKYGCLTYNTADLYEKAMRKAYKKVHR